MLPGFYAARSVRMTIAFTYYIRTHLGKIRQTLSKTIGLIHKQFSAL